MLESVKKLRELVEKSRDEYVQGNVSYNGGFNDIADEIEREIAENYIALPKDADGKSWHLGDITENGNRVNGMTFDSHGWHFANTLNDIDPSIHRHVKPDPLKELLDEFATDIANYKHDGVDFDVYAERIREALGVE